MEGEREAQSRTVGARRPTPEEQLMAPTSVPSDTAILRPGPRLTTAWVLSSVVLVLMATSSAVGLLVEGIYPEETWAVAALRGNDLVTLVLVVPVLALALAASRLRPSSASVLVWLGMLLYGLYNFAYYSFGAAFNDLFLLHVAAYSLSGIAMVLLGTSIDADVAARGVVGGVRAKVVAAFTLGVGIALLGAWGAMSVRVSRTGELPQEVMPPEAVHLVYAIDMGILAPMFVIAGVLLWRAAPWGAVMGVAVNASGAAYLMVLEVVGGFQADAGIPGASWLSPVAIGAVLACLLATLALLVRPHPSRTVARGRPAPARA
ncbi:MAG: hypothetical protein K0R30_304 [Ornithinibacter sp.]|nr:hypothetical protein [Ornithinibacter sp.]